MKQLKLLRRFERKPNVLAFGVQYDTCKYRLALARYAAIIPVVRLAAYEHAAVQLLDVGCGPGTLRRWCPFDAVEFTGIDVNADHAATARAAGYAHVAVGNVVDGLPFAPCSFDVVVLSHILEHLQDPGPLVSEAMRVLRPGGRVIVGVPMHTALGRLLRIHVAPIIMPSKRREVLAANFGHVQFYTMRSLRAALSEFEIQEIRGFRVFSAGRYLPLENWRWYFRLNAWLGRLLPQLTAEVNAVGRKRDDAGAVDRSAPTCKPPAQGPAHDVAPRRHGLAGGRTGSRIGSRFEHVHWDVDFLERMPAVRSPGFGIPSKVKAVRYPIRLARYWFMYQLLRREAKARGRALEICEVGVDTGQMLRFAQAASASQGARVAWARWSGVDCALKVPELEDAGYTELIDADVEDPAFELPAEFDMMITLHVLEHLHKPEAALEQVVQYLRPGGLVIGGFPVTPAPFANRREQHLRANARPLGHLSAFSPARVRQMAAGCGLEVEFMTGAFLMRRQGFVLENFAWWYRLNLVFGAALPGWPGEIYWALRKPRWR